MPSTAAAPGAELFLPADRSLGSLAAAAQHCRGCPLWARATQAVFGEGPPGATLVLVGEQPGDVEDESGRPFVGPAGALLDRCLEDAGIDRETVYVTNAVKHFKWEPRGKRRIHSKPSRGEVRACAPWLDAELEVVAPRGIVLLGATAAQAVLGPTFRVTAHHGERLATDRATFAIATLHPSALLRAPDSETRERQTADLVEDLRRAREWAT